MDSSAFAFVIGGSIGLVCGYMLAAWFAQASFNERLEEERRRIQMDEARRRGRIRHD